MTKNAQLIYVGIGDIKPLPGNAKKHVDGAIARSIARFGFVEPVVINDVTGHLLAGHGRLDALRAMRDAGDGVPVGVDVADGVWRVPSYHVHVPADDEGAVSLALNRLVEKGGWDRDMVQAMLASMNLEDVGIAGFDASWMGSVAGVTDQDDIPQAVEQRAAIGDIWACGNHVVFCGDATDARAVVTVFDGVDASAAMMVTDPPYGVDYDPAWRARAGVNKSRKKLGKVVNDGRADWSNAWELFPGPVAYVWHGGLKASIVQASLERCGFELRSQIIWAKDRMALSRGDYHWQHEPCWYAVRRQRKAKRTDDRSQSTLWSIPAREDGGHGHGTQKPVECMERPIRNHHFGVVYDPFLGSGTTLIACERARRRCLAIEINPAYVDIAITRWEQYTAQTATRVST